MVLPLPTVEELVQTLKRTTFPTLLVEGNDDAALYRHLEHRMRLPGGTIHACGGRGALLTVYERRSEFPNVRTAFLADRDLWLFSAVPEQYEGVFFTSGYSIENDLLAGSNVEGLLEPAENAAYRCLIAELCRWFAHEISLWRRGQPHLLDVHINRIVKDGTFVLDEEWSRSRDFSEPDRELFEAIHAEYGLKLRGKNLLQALVRYLSASNRGSTKHSKSSLLEIAAKFSTHERLETMVRVLRDRLGLKEEQVQGRLPAIG